MIRRPPRSTLDRSSAASDVYKRQALFGTRVWLAVELCFGLDDVLWLHQLQQASRLTGVPLVAAGDVHMHVRSRKPMQLSLIHISEPTRPY